MKSTLPPIPESSPLIQDIQHNCDISDARDHGIYSMCTMILKLRNLYKWENQLQPWEEPVPADLLNWIEAKENGWETIAGESFRLLSISGKTMDPFALEEINSALCDDQVVYGAGYGRSMKTVFFLAEKIEGRSSEGCPILVLGKELAREMASPFAMVQDGLIIIRREALRFFFWDQIQEIRSCRNSLPQALQPYGVFNNGVLDQERLKSALDNIVDEEMNLFIYHEIGEILQTTFTSGTLRAIVGHFPGTVIEHVGRAVKDILADTHPHGLVSYIVRDRREASLGFYLSFLDGLRERLFPEGVKAWQRFLVDRDWQHIEQARNTCWERNQQVAERITMIAERMDKDPDELIINRFNYQILQPLGLATAKPD
jgi:hypothetical protein